MIPPGTRDPLAELSAWKSGHKARACRIEIDNSYGATCWEIELNGEGGRKVCSSEAAMLMERVYDDWPGLSAVILDAIDHWNKGETKP